MSNCLKMTASYCVFISSRLFSTNGRLYNCKRLSHSIKIMGIETSCDDTGCAIINGNGQILSQTLHTQGLVHLRNGGIIPDIAQTLHRQSIEPVVQNTLSNANLSIEDLTAIAVTVKPGLPLSLAIGMKYAKHLARKYKKPLIPIHHMEAHALTIRIQKNIKFPFLSLLISGPHSFLTVVNDVNKLILLGESIDTGPGEIFDKAARHMKLRNVSEYSKICGGHAIELAASKSKNPSAFNLPLPLTDYKDCNFSFNGLKSAVLYQIHKKEKEHNTVAHNLIPEVNDLCASFLTATTKHLVHRTQRAMEFCKMHNLIPENNQELVVSGGVASNNFIYKGLQQLCDEFEYKISRPPRELCTDNGVMIAWNGLEKWLANIDTNVNIDTLDIEPDCPLGINFVTEVSNAKLPVKVLKIKLFG